MKESVLGKSLAATHLARGRSVAALPKQSRMEYEEAVYQVKNRERFGPLSESRA